ncbi:hypothetical protein CF319_g2233 [Tilletia indica]|nr:hypothetical protein CF319_g2233 [Tilletia indica]
MQLNPKFTLLLCALLMAQPVLSTSTSHKDDTAELIPRSGAIGPGTKNDLSVGDDLGFNTKGSGKGGSDAFDRRDGLNLGLEHGHDAESGAYGIGKGFPDSNKKEKVSRRSQILRSIWRIKVNADTKFNAAAAHQVLHHNDLFAKKIAAAKKKSGFGWLL